MTTPRERLAALPSLSAGGHEHVDEGACFMEAVSYVAGEPWSDKPACACPVLGAFLRTWNDDLSDTDRDRLLRLTPALVPHADALTDLPPIVDAQTAAATIVAARAAARAAAVDAAVDAAWDAAVDALQPTVATLQLSALDLVDRMLAETASEEP